jgi:predicted cobalt transporter CbtA
LPHARLFTNGASIDPIGVIVAAALTSATPALQEALGAALKRLTTRGHSDDAVTPSPSTSDAAVETALALDPDTVSRDARRRFALVLRINLVISIALAVILVGAIVGAIVSALMGRGALAGVFGGLTLVDLAGAMAYKPLDAINQALVATQRLDIIHFSTRERLLGCAQLPSPAERNNCAAPVWAQIKEELTALSK